MKHRLAAISTGIATVMLITVALILSLKPGRQGQPVSAAGTPESSVYVAATRGHELVSNIDAEKNQELPAEAQANLKMQQATLDLRKLSVDTEIKLLEIQRDREKLAMDQSRANFDRLVVKAPVSGMVVLLPF